MRGRNFDVTRTQEARGRIGDVTRAREPRGRYAHTKHTNFVPLDSHPVDL